MIYSVGQSKVKTWRGCRQAYHFKYEDRLQRRRVRRPFVFGTIVHRMIEARAQEQDPFEVLEEIELDDLPIFTAERDMYGEIISDVGVIMREYFDYHNDGLRFLPIRDETGEMRFAEHEFDVPLAELVSRKRRGEVDGIVFKGQVDGLGKTPNRLRWIIEHKSFDKLPSEDERWRNLQAIVYRRAILHLDWVTGLDGVCWNYIMSKPPTVPQVLKDGKRMSVKEITTLPSVVRAALEKAGLGEEGHERLMERAFASRRQYFQRIYTPINATVADRVFDDFVSTSVEMRDLSGRRREKSIGRHCSWCDYEPLCRTELTGGDADFVRASEFSVEDPEGYRRTKRSDKLKVVK